MMQRSLTILTLILGALGSRVGRPTPGTETILLVKGGYGPGVNLISAAPAVTKRRHGVHKAPMDRTEKEEVEVKNLDEVGKVISTLQTQIATVGQETAKVLSEAEASRVERDEMSNKLAKDTATLEQQQRAEKQLMQLQVQAQQLRSQLTAEKAKAAAEKARNEAFVSKVQLLEKDLQISSKAWKALAAHEAAVAKAAQPKPVKSAVPAKTLPAATEVTSKKAAVPAHKSSTGPKPKVIHTKSTTNKKPVTKETAKVQKKDTAAQAVPEDDITDDVLASDSDDDVDDDASKADADSAEVASADDSDSQADDDSEGY